MLDLKAMERIDRLVRRHQELTPAGTKRKIPEPPTSPSLRSLAESINGRRQQCIEMSRAAITSGEELLREVDEYLAKQQGGQDQEHLDMEQG